MINAQEVISSKKWRCKVNGFAIDNNKMKTIKTLITEKDFETLRNKNRLRFKDNENNVEIVLEYLKDG